MLDNHIRMWFFFSPLNAFLTHVSDPTQMFWTQDTKQAKGMGYGRFNQDARLNMTLSRAMEQKQARPLEWSPNGKYGLLER